MGYIKTEFKNTLRFEKNGVNFVGYGNVNENVGIVTETIEKGHFEEFVHDKSTFIYLFLEGKGIFFLDDEQVKVKAGDMLVVQPGTRIYYFGKLKQVLITSPAWEQKYERHIRNVDESESPYLNMK